jgi:hypothetical protein
VSLGGKNEWSIFSLSLPEAKILLKPNCYGWRQKNKKTRQLGRNRGIPKTQLGFSLDQNLNIHKKEVSGRFQGLFEYWSALATTPASISARAGAKEAIIFIETFVFCFVSPTIKLFD